MKNSALFILALLFLSASFISIQSQQRKMMHQDGNKENLREQLNLSEDQMKKIDDLRLIHNEKMIDIKAELAKKKLEMKKLRSGDELSRNELLKITKEMSEIKIKIAVEKVNHQMDVYDQLSKEQKKIWSKMHFNKERRMNMDKMHDGKRDRDRL
jgi:Spy/CpxP family protein refolding chaperone